MASHGKREGLENSLSPGPGDTQDDWLMERCVQREMAGDGAGEPQSAKRVFGQMLGTLGFFRRQQKATEIVEAVIGFMC